MKWIMLKKGDLPRLDLGMCAYLAKAEKKPKA